MDTSQVRVVEPDGELRLSVGREYAGKLVLIDQVSPDTLVIKFDEAIPKSELWLYQGDNLAKLERALAWNEEHEPVDNFDQFIKENMNDYENADC